ncbi:protein turtle isoform X3 [Episyrphus balteatus]|uniref:protein turtle isoform X3 n=1 Tax=Episyrphus balteatus TaxID=286459 RepID=UPI0024855439|nr:protein turtle isoform X3 [Episyrphus balteatus]
MGVCADPGSYRWCQALSRSRSSFATTTTTTTTTTTKTTKTNKSTTKTTAVKTATTTYRKNYSIISRTTQNLTELFKSLELVFLVFVILTKTTFANIPEDAVHITAILGEGVIFNCHVEFPNDHPVPYVLQWDKKGSDLPIYIWYESYPEHIEEGYKGRVSRVSQDSPFGSASLNLTNIKEADQGWYECKVVFLNRDPKQHKNGTWFHLDVHAPPRFSVTPEDIIYVNLGDSIILNCQADGTPTPEILWYKDANPVDPSSTVGIFNDGTELRISTIRNEDIGEYTCIARNGEGQVSHTARVIIAGGAVIMPDTGKADELKKVGITVPPTNQTKLEGEKVMFSCEAKAMPGNVTVRWFREGSPVREVASLDTRVTIRKDGSLIINPVSADDSGQYLCEVSNGIGDPQSASAYLNVEYPAKVTFTPTVQYLPFRLAGVVQCYIKSNPPLQYVTWIKDKLLLEPYQTKDIVIMNNGSLLFTRVGENHQGRYTCTPYNAQGTQGSSGPMEVLVRKPPIFTVEPETLYQRKVGDSVEMHCDAIEAEGTPRPTIKWQKQDGVQLTESQKSRVKINGGNITIESLRREDFGYYQCVVSNEVATLMSATQLVIEGTQPHAPYNITGKATESSITLQWMPGYSGGQEYKQDYTIWYREAGVSDWQTISVTPSGSTQVTINGLAPGMTYEFQVVGSNALGAGMMSKVMTVRTLDTILEFYEMHFRTDSNGSIIYNPPKLKLRGPKPGQPRNLTVQEVSNGFLISWQSPLERAHIVKFYTIKYRTDSNWKTLNRGQIRPEETQYLVKNLVGGRTYYFRVLANSEKSFESSDEVKFPVPARVKHKAITAGVVGGILFFIVAIILSVCAVKICNKRKRRKQEKEFNMVACRITDARNIAANRTGCNSSGQVPLKKYKQARISSVTTVFITILHWIWPPDRCTNCHSIYSTPNIDEIDGNRRSVGQIHRSVDGRFVLSETPDVQQQDSKSSNNNNNNKNGERRNSTGSQNSSSDDGGFLARRNFINSRASWRRPLVASPSQLSLQSNSSARGFLNGLGGLLRVGAGRYQNVPRNQQYANVYRNLPQPASRPLHQNLHINTLAVPQTPITPNLYTPSRVSRIFSSSPASTIGIHSPWSPAANQFSDLSTVYPSSAERSFPTPSSGGLGATASGNTAGSRYHRYYSHELPSLRTIQEETRRMNQGFVPLHIPPSPSWRGYYQSQTPYHSYRPRTRWYPRHSRVTRSHSELLSPLPHLNFAAAHYRPSGGMGLEASPESRSSSSGFGSKNTSNQQHGSHHSGSTSEWRLLPPYRPPPPPPSTSYYYQDPGPHYHHHHSLHHHHHHHPAAAAAAAAVANASATVGTQSTLPYYNNNNYNTTGGSLKQRPTTPPYTMGNWLDMISRLNAATDTVNVHKAVDVGSVDGHYEFDPSTPTPSASTPTGGPRDDLNLLNIDTGSTVGGIFHTATSGMPPTAAMTLGPPMRKQRYGASTRYDNIETRVQAMKEEFYAYRKRQAMKRAGVVELESMC